MCVIDVLLCSAHAMDASDPLSDERREFYTHARRVPSVARELTDLNVGPGGSRTTGQRACVCVSIPQLPCSYRRMLFTHDDVLYTRQTQKEERER